MLIEHVYDVVWSVIRLHKNVSMKQIRDLPLFEKHVVKREYEQFAQSNEETKYSHVFQNLYSQETPKSSFTSDSQISDLFFEALTKECGINLEDLTSSKNPSNSIPLSLSAHTSSNMQSNNRALNHTEVKTQDMLKPSLVKPRNHVHNLTGHQNPASLTPENIVLYIKRKYYESLYVTKTPIAYFAKSTLSRARAVCEIDIKYNEKLAQSTSGQQESMNSGINTLISALSTLILEVQDLDSKYNRDDFAHTLISIESNQANSKTSADSRSRKNDLSDDIFMEGDLAKLFASSGSGFNYTKGAYSDMEFKYLKQWVISKSQKHPELFRELSLNVSSSMPSEVAQNTFSQISGQRGPLSLNALIEMLKVREIQLQLILLLEVMSLQKLQEQLVSTLKHDGTVHNSLQPHKKKKKVVKRRLAIGPVKRKLGTGQVGAARPKVGLSYIDDSEENHSNEDSSDDEIAKQDTNSKLLYPIGTITSFQGKKINLDSYSDLLFDRLCIWQAITLVDANTANKTATNSKSSNPKASSNTTEGGTSLKRTPAQVLAESDKAQEFCREVVLPFFNARLEHKCKEFFKTAKGISGRGVAAKSASKRDEESFISMTASVPPGGSLGPDKSSFTSISVQDSLLSSIQQDSFLAPKLGTRIASKSNIASSYSRSRSASIVSSPADNVSLPSPNIPSLPLSRNSTSSSTTGLHRRLATKEVTPIPTIHRGGLMMTSQQVSETRNIFEMPRRSTAKLSKKTSNSVIEDTNDSSQVTKQKRFGATLVSSISHTLTKETKKSRHSMPGGMMASNSDYRRSGEFERVSQSQSTMTMSEKEAVQVGSTPKKRRRPEYEASEDYYGSFQKSQYRDNRGTQGYQRDKSRRHTQIPAYEYEEYAHEMSVPVNQSPSTGRRLGAISSSSFNRRQSYHPSNIFHDRDSVFQSDYSAADEYGVILGTPQKPRSLQIPNGQSNHDYGPFHELPPFFNEFGDRDEHADEIDSLGDFSRSKKFSSFEEQLSNSVGGSEAVMVPAGRTHTVYGSQNEATQVIGGEWNSDDGSGIFNEAILLTPKRKKTKS